MKQIKFFSFILLLSCAIPLLSMNQDEEVVKEFSKKSRVIYQQPYFNEEGYYEGDIICIKNTEGTFRCRLQQGNKKIRDLPASLGAKLEKAYDSNKKLEGWVSVDMEKTEIAEKKSSSTSPSTASVASARGASMAPASAASSASATLGLMALYMGKLGPK